MSRIRKAVFPAAGLGTRFLPATKAQPKEMLPLVDKPIIQYGVEEALASGVDNILLVTGRGKNAIEDHFDVSVELETFLEARGKHEMLAEVRKISNLINFAYVRQGEPLGLGHAVLVTRELVGNEPFAVILSDDVIDAEPPALKQMIDVYDEAAAVPCCASSACRARTSRATASSRTSRTPSLPNGVYRVTDLVEKPPRGAGAVGPRDHRALHPDAGHLHVARRDRRRIAPARFSSPTACAICCARGRSTPARSTACGTTPATSWGS